MHLRLVAILLVTACSTTASDGDDTGSAQQNSCVGPLGAALSMTQIEALPGCCTDGPGDAHCLASVPDEIAPFLATCDGGGACVPDSFLATGAAVPPAQCTAFGGPGVCLSKCIPQVAENQGILDADTCAGEGELCVPCTNPLDGTPTGACDLLTLATCNGDSGGDTPPAACDDPATCAYDAGCPPVIDPASLTACAADAHCLAANLISDPAEVAQLGKCADGTSLCVPDTFIATGGKLVPPTCASVNGEEGRCLSAALPAVAAEAAMLPQDTCAATEKCTPCYSPIDGTPTGACALSCDTGPTQPAKPFATCCDDRARCVPTTSVPEDEQDQLKDDSCDDGNLCVPNEILANGPYPACAANSFIIGDYTGVCLSTCLDFGFEGIALAKGDCDSGFKCAPCETFGQPTGAPGCPP